MWVFPEGTRNNTGDILPFKKGAFHVAIAAQIPVLPVIFSSYYFLDNKKKEFESGVYCCSNFIHCNFPVALELTFVFTCKHLKENCYFLNYLTSFSGLHVF
jgi:1-acyl-sn-glycerol-3-phosphate acyltransferase